jgi:general secretion pathway protein G
MKIINMKQAFTLIEILVVATIIGLLAALSSTGYSQFNKQARDAKRKADLENIRAALEMYRSNNSYYPSSLNILVNQYLSTLPVDPLSAQAYAYVYSPLPGGCSNNCTDYTLGSYLETGSGAVCLSNCYSGVCNYCLGPYGQK